MTATDRINRLDALCDKLERGKIKPIIAHEINSAVRNQTNIVSLALRRAEFIAQHGEVAAKKVPTLENRKARASR